MLFKSLLEPLFLRHCQGKSIEIQIEFEDCWVLKIEIINISVDVWQKNERDTDGIIQKVLKSQSILKIVEF